MTSEYICAKKAPMHSSFDVCMEAFFTMETNFVPVIAGGIVLSFVGVYAGRRWLYLDTN